MKSILLFWGIVFGMLRFGAAQNISYIEYFIDVDPGFGKGRSLGFSSSPTIEGLNFNVNLTTVSPGFHKLYLRSRDDKGNWSFVQWRAFVKMDVAKPMGKISYIEYFVDKDPGFGKAKSLAFTPADSVKDFSFQADIGKQDAGLHMLCIRSKDANGNWSFLAKKGFIQVGPTLPPSKIIRIEYFVDQDPGFGKGIHVPVPLPSLDVKDLTFTVDLAPYSLGNHTLFVRSQDSLGRWGLVEAKTFRKTEANGLAEWNEANLLEVFPNPSHGMVTIKLAGRSLKGAWNMEVLDQGGTVVNKMDNVKDQDLDLSFLPKGVYFLRFYQDSMQYYKKVVLN